MLIIYYVLSKYLNFIKMESSHQHDRRQTQRDLFHEKKAVRI